MSTASGLMEMISEVPAPGGLVSGSAVDIPRSARVRRTSRTTTSAAAVAAAASPALRRSRSSRPDAQRLIRASLPLLLAVSLLILIPAVWSLGYFADLPVWKHDDPKAGQIAAALTVTWPMAIILVSTATYFWTRRHGV